MWIFDTPTGSDPKQSCSYKLCTEIEWVADGLPTPFQLVGACNTSVFSESQDRYHCRCGTALRVGQLSVGLRKLAWEEGVVDTYLDYSTHSDYHLH